MSVINTNITSLIAQQNLNASKSDLTTAMERLSSGLRINSSADDAAGQAIANRMSAQITGLSQAQRNANDGISVAQTTEGALNQVNDNLQRIRELTVQAQNGTNSEEDLQSIQDEITARLDEIGRVSEETSFNGVKVLASDQSISIQVGANDGETIDIKLSEINAETLGLEGFSVGGTSVANTAATETDLYAAGFSKQGDGTYLSSADFNRAATIADTFGTLEDGGTVTSGATYTYSADSESFSFDRSVTAAATSAEFKADLGLPAAGETKTVTYTNGAETQDINIASDGSITNSETGEALFIDTATGNLSETDGGATAVGATADTLADYFVSANANGNSAAITDGDTTYTADATAGTYTVTGDTISSAQLQQDMAAATYTLDSEGDTTNDFTVTSGAVVDGGGTAQFISGFDGSSFVDADTATISVNAEDAFVNSSNTAEEIFVKADGSLTTEATSGATATENPLAALDSALSQVDGLRSDLGALQNRFDSAITNLATTEVNLTAARSRIQDADYATEVSNMTRNQILQQAGTSILAQANQLPQSVLSLLG